MEKQNAILHFSDRHLQEKYYEAPLDLIKELKSKIKNLGFKDAWGWWTNHVDYDNDNTKPVKHGIVDMTLDSYFLDYNNDLESIGEWSF